MGPTEVFSCLYVSSLISSQPPFEGWGNTMAGEANLGGCVLWRLLFWVYYAKEHSMNGDKSSSLGIQKPFPSDNGILVQSWGCAETPPLFQRIITPFPLLFSKLAVCTSAHTTAFLPSCTLACTLHWCYVVYKAKNWKTGQCQIYICTYNLKSTHSHICALSDAGVLMKCVILTLSQN